MRTCCLRHTQQSYGAARRRRSLPSFITTPASQNVELAASTIWRPSRFGLCGLLLQLSSNKKHHGRCGQSLVFVSHHFAVGLAHVPGSHDVWKDRKRRQSRCFDSRGLSQDPCQRGSRLSCSGRGAAGCLSPWPTTPGPIPLSSAFDSHLGKAAQNRGIISAHCRPHTASTLVCIVKTRRDTLWFYFLHKVLFPCTRIEQVVIQPCF